MRVAALRGLAVLGDQIPDDLDALSRRARALHNHTRKIAVLQAVLRRRRHVDQFLPVVRPHVPHGDALLVEAAVGQRCGEALQVRVLHAQIAEHVVDLRDGGILGDADADCGICSMATQNSATLPTLTLTTLTFITLTLIPLT